MQKTIPTRVLYYISVNGNAGSLSDVTFPLLNRWQGFKDGCVHHFVQKKSDTQVGISFSDSIVMVKKRDNEDELDNNALVSLFKSF
jgi:hypothetical protein